VGLAHENRLARGVQPRPTPPATPAAIRHISWRKGERGMVSGTDGQS